MSPCHLWFSVISETTSHLLYYRANGLSVCNGWGVPATPAYTIYIMRFVDICQPRPETASTPDRASTASLMRVSISWSMGAFTGSWHFSSSSEVPMKSPYKGRRENVPRGRPDRRFWVSKVREKVTRLCCYGNRCWRHGNRPRAPFRRTSGIQIVPDCGSVDSQLPFDGPQRHALALGCLDRLPSLLLKESRLARSDSQRWHGGGLTIGDALSPSPH